jgi:hypothetical protein
MGNPPAAEAAVPRAVAEEQEGVRPAAEVPLAAAEPLGVEGAVGREDQEVAAAAEEADCQVSDCRELRYQTSTRSKLGLDEAMSPTSAIHQIP